MSKHTLFLLLALTIQVFNDDRKVGEITLKSCEYVTFDGATSDKLIEELEEDYCSFLKTSGDFTHCCLFEFSSGTPQCYQITDDQYENIGRFKKYLRDQSGDDDLGIECSSRFVSFSLLAVLALLF